MTEGGELSDARRLGTGASLVLVGTILGRGLKLAMRVLIARLLGAASLGLYDLGLTIVLILSQIARSGLQVAVIRYGTPLWHKNPRALRSLAWRGLALPLSLGAAFALTLFLQAPWIASAVFRKPELESVIRVLAFLVPLGAGLAVLAGVTQAVQRMRYTVLVRDLAEPAFQFALFLALWVLGFGLASALIGALAGGALAFLLAIAVVLRLTRPRAERVETPDAPPQLRELVAFSLPVGLAGMLVTHLLWVDRLLVGYFRPSTEVGVYSAAAQFGILFGLLLHAFNTVFTPMFSGLLERGEWSRMRELYRISTKWGLYALLPLMVVLAIVPETALVGLFGPDFAIGARPLQILLLGQLVNVVTGQVGMVLVLTGDRGIWMGLSGAALVLNVVLDIIWLPQYGLAGAAAASALAITLLFGGGVYRLYQRHGMTPVDRRIRKLVAPSLACAVAVWVSRWLGLPATAFGLVAAVGVAYVTFGGARALLAPDPEDRELWAEVRKRMRAAVEREP